MSESDFGESYYRHQSVYRQFKNARAATRALENYQYGFYRYLRRRYLKDLSRAARVLEVGCGYSGLVGHLIRDGYVYTGWDVSGYIVGEMKKIYPDLEFLQKDIQEAGNAAAEFDLVISLQVLEHLPRPELGLKNIFSLLQEDGLFLATAPNPRSKIPFTDWRIDPTHISVFSHETWLRLLREAGFTRVESTTFFTLPWFWRFLPTFSQPFFLPEFGASIFLCGRKS